VLALGLLSLVAGIFLVPLGIVAWILGSKDLRAMDEGRVDPAGRSLTQIGRVFGIAATILWILSAGCVATTFSVRAVETVEASTDGRDSDRTVKIYYSTTALDRSPAPIEYEYREIARSDGEWVKDGPYLHKTRDGTTLEEGVYRDGLREGEWIYGDADGVMDEPKSGIYERDVRVQKGRSPPFIR
jgi:hypothetical protein